MPNGHSHRGDLNTLFHHGHPETSEEGEKSESLKQSLLTGLSFILSDENKRYFVPELNFGSEEQLNVDLKTIINDLMGAGIQFVDPE